VSGVARSQEKGGERAEGGPSGGTRRAHFALPFFTSPRDLVYQSPDVDVSSDNTSWRSGGVEKERIADDASPSLSPLLFALFCLTMLNFRHSKSTPLTFIRIISASHRASYVSVELGA
jgi:hypothetical protein